MRVLTMERIDRRGAVAALEREERGVIANVGVVGGELQSALRISADVREVPARAL
jgi:hypothetical protein